jgi:hypothetical protein
MTAISIRKDVRAGFDKKGGNHRWLCFPDFTFEISPPFIFFVGVVSQKIE